MKMTNLKDPIRGDKLDPVTGLLPRKPLDLSQFEGHTPTLSTLAHDLVTDAAHNAVPDLLHAQLVRDLAEATEEDITALLAECRAQRDQIAALEAALQHTVRVIIGTSKGRQFSPAKRAAVEQARAALAATQGADK